MPQDLPSSSNPMSSANSTQKRVAQRGKGRKFFQQIQPTFAIELPRTTIKLEFLDENDPAKDTIVRKKAREWVNKNRENSSQARRKPPRSKSSPTDSSASTGNEDSKQIVRRHGDPEDFKIESPRKFGSRCLDPFSILPDIGREYGHIIDYFLTSCPEEIPCSDDKYAKTAGSSSVVKFSRHNTVLGNMAKGQTSFILWLYATVTIRDGMLGTFGTQEIFWYYTKALAALRETLEEETKSGKYSDNLVNALACITATASFSGMFPVAELHRNALIRVLDARGDGDVLAGIRTLEQWSQKAVQWCEIMVATQIVEVPHIPYFHPFEPEPLPENVIAEAETLTTNSLANLPPLSPPLQDIIRLLHQLGVCFALRPYIKQIDSYIIQPLYHVEYAILSILSAHRESPFLSDVEVLLAETFQLYFWTGPRTLPPQTRLCDLLISRIMKALLPLLLEKVSGDIEKFPVAASGCATDADTTKSMATTLRHDRPTNNVIAWSLALGTVVSMALGRPEHWWLRGHLHLYVSAMDISRDQNTYEELLRLFPATECFSWIDLRILFPKFPAPSAQVVNDSGT